MNKNQKKVLWLASWYPSRSQPFNGDFIQRHAAAVAAQGSYAVAVLYAEPIAGLQQYEVTVQQISDLHPLEVIVFYPDLPKYLRFFKLLRFFYANIIGLRRLKTLDFAKPDLIHLCAVFPAGIVALWFSFFKNIPFLLSEHWTGYHAADGGFSRGSFLQKTLIRRSFARAKAVINVTPQMTDSMQRLGLTLPKVFIVPNVVNTEDFYPILSKKNDKCQLIHVSTLSDKHKNFGSILRAVRALSEQRQDFVLHVVGDGEEGKKWQQLAKDWNILDNFVQFHGNQPHAVVAEWYQKSDAFVLFSNFEGLPCVLLEALCAGLPVIATETGNISDWVTVQEGVLLAVGDEVGLLRALHFMLNHYAAFDPLQLHQKIAERCSCPVVGQKIIEAYAEVLANP